MNKPTKEQREKIDTAIDKIASLCSDGAMSPSKAVAKVASAMKLTPDYLPIIVRAYNTGAAAIHREESNTLQEKAASYPIAYLEEVMSILKQDFPMGKKASAPAVKDDFWDYPATVHFPDAWDYLKEEEEPVATTVKKASAKPHQVLDARKAVMNAADVAANEATRIKYAAEEERNNAYDDVVRELRKSGGIKPDVARDYAKATYGKEGLKIINKMIADNYMDKKAQYQRETYIPDSHPFAKAFDNFVFKNEEFKKAAAKEKEVLGQCVNIVNQYVRPKERYIEGMDSIDQMFKEAEIARKKKREQGRIKQAYKPLSASGVGGITGLEAINHPGWVGLDRFERELMYGLADPAHEAELRRIRVQSILIDLLNTDPYLKEKDPEEVLDAMNEILEINPDIHKNKPMLRVALRQFMESGGMDIPTLGVVSEFGKEERQRKSQEKTQRENAAAQFAAQIESARQADEKLRSEEERSREDREARERLQKAEQEFKHRETLEERSARQEEAKTERQFRREERELGQAFTTSEREAGEAVQRELAQLQRQLQADEGLANRMSSEEIARLGRIVQLQEGGENRKAQKELAQLQRELQEREGQKQRTSQETIAREGRRSQEEIARLGRESQESEGHLNRLAQGTIARLGRESQEGIAAAQRKLQEREGGRNRSAQWRIANENRKAQADLEFDRQKFQANLAKRQMKEQKDIANKQTNTQESIAKAQREQQEALDLIRRQHEVEMANQRAIWEQEAAKERDAQQRELQRQQQEWEKKLELAKAEAEALRTSFAKGDLNALGISSLDDLQDRIQGQFNKGYDTSRMSTPGYNLVGYTNRSTMKTPYNKEPLKKTP